MKDNTNYEINSSKKEWFIHDSVNGLNQEESVEGVILGFKDSQILDIENILNVNKLPTKQTSLKTILKNKDILFNNEFYSLNSLYTSIDCYIKIDKKYDYGKLTINDKTIVVELYKKLLKLKEWSFSNINPVHVKNNSSDNQLPNYKMNDTIDKVLTGRDLMKESDKNLPIHILNINLDLVTCKLIIHKEKLKFRLLLLGYKNNESKKYLKNIKVIKFNCINAEKSRFYHICEIINRSILLSEGYNRNLFGVNFRKNYYTKPFISVLNFVKEANTCDIILFKTLSFAAKCQRCVTGGDFDHIAILIKTNNNLKLYDCIDDEGVRLRTFSEFMIFLYPLYYEKISYRKLNIRIEDMIQYIHNNNFDEYENIDNNDNYNIENISLNEIKNKFYQIINKKLEIFIQKNLKLKYDFPYCKYFCKPKKNKYKPNMNRTSYFCSELVAAVYMFCNIMSKEYDPNDYLPGHFGEKGKIEFINGFHFGPETIIEFSD